MVHDGHNNGHNNGHSWEPVTDLPNQSGTAKPVSLPLNQSRCSYR